jgi:hypothetical protein
LRSYAIRPDHAPEETGPGQISDALVGFEVDQEPFGAIALDADDDGEHMRVEVSAM